MDNTVGGLINVNEDGAPLYVSAGMNTDIFSGVVALVDAERFFEVAPDYFVFEDGFGTPESPELREYLYDKQRAAGGLIAPSLAVVSSFGDYGEEPELRDIKALGVGDKRRLAYRGELEYLKSRGAEMIPIVLNSMDEKVLGTFYDVLDVDEFESLERRLYKPREGFLTTVTDLAARTYVQGIREYEAFYHDFLDQRESLQRGHHQGALSKERLDWELRQMDELYERQSAHFGAFPDMHKHVMVLVAAGVEQVRIPDYFDSEAILSAVSEQANGLRDFDLSGVPAIELVSRYERMLALNPQDTEERTAMIMIDGKVDVTRQMLRGQLIDAIKADDEAVILARNLLRDDQVRRFEADMLDIPGPLFNDLRAE